MDKAKYNSQIATAAEAVTAFINPMHSGGGHWLAQAIAAARLVHDNKDNIKNIVNRLTGE